MRVLYIWPAGMAQTAIARIEAVAQSGVDVALICARSWPEGGSTAHASQARASFPIIARWAVPSGRGAYYFYPMGVSAPLRRFKPDLVHVREEMYTVFAGQFLLERRLRFATTPYIFESWQNIRKRYPWPARLFEEVGYRQAAGAIAGAPSVEQVLRSGGFHGPIETIPLGGVQPESYGPDGPSMRAQGGYVGYAGRLTREKGLDLLIEAAAMMSPRPSLLFAGDGAERSSLLGLAREREVDLELLGPIAQQDIPEFLRSLEALVLPSRTTPRWKEQWGRVLTEAMACGVPVIGSSSGEIPYVIGDAGVVFPEGSAEGLRRALVQVLGDKELRGRLIQKGLERVQELSWSSLAERTVGFYRRVLR